MAKGVIYTLSDETGVRYIGQTIRPKQRYSAHCSILHNKSNSTLNQWLRGLLTEDKKPSMEIILYTDDLDKEEIRLIAEYREKGFELVNTAKGGKDTDFIFNKTEARPWGRYHSPLQRRLIQIRDSIQISRYWGFPESADQQQIVLDRVLVHVRKVGKQKMNMILWYTKDQYLYE